LRLWEDSLELT